MTFIVRHLGLGRRPAFLVQSKSPDRQLSLRRTLLTGLFRSKVKCKAEVPVCSSCRKRKVNCRYGPSPTKQVAEPASTATIADENVFSASEPLISGHVSAVRSGIDAGLPSPLSTRDVNEHRRTPDYSSSLTYMDLFSLDPLNENLNVQPSFGWIFDDLPDVGFQTFPEFDEAFPTTPSQHHPNIMPQQSTSAGITEGPDSRIQAHPLSSADDRTAPEDSWPSDWEYSQAQRLILPDIGGPDETVPAANHYSTSPITTSGRLKIIDSIRIPLDRGPWPNVSLTKFPSCDRLDHCVDLFFVHFNKVCFNTHELVVVTDNDSFSQ